MSCRCRECRDNAHGDRISETVAELMALLWPRQDFRDSIFDRCSHTVRASLTAMGATGDTAGELSRLERICESFLADDLNHYCDKDWSINEAADRIRANYLEAAA